LSKSSSQKENTIEKKFEDGKLMLIVDPDGYVKGMNAEFRHQIKIEAYYTEKTDEVTITRFYRDGSIETMMYAFEPGRPGYEAPWFINDIDYYHDYLKEKSMKKLVEDILSYIKNQIDYMIKNVEVTEE